MKTTAISILGTNLDQRGNGAKRWEKWRPTLSLCQQDDLLIDRMVILHEPNFDKLARLTAADIQMVSPQTAVELYPIHFDDPWDFETVYSGLYDFSQAFEFDPDNEKYLVHITTGTHVAQICLYLLVETHYLPGQLIQSSPGSRQNTTQGSYQIIDLDLSKYDQIASRFERQRYSGVDYLKDGIQTRNAEFNRMIEQLEKVSILSDQPMLITGPTGAGKTQLVKRIFALKQQRGQVQGQLVSVNCATLQGDKAMSTLFGHRKGAFTGAVEGRQGLLKEADRGVLFLDEIGELGLDEQAMLLRAIEEKSYLPLGADREIHSNFQLVAGTNRDLIAACAVGKFREDLLARINLWSYRLPSLRERLEDLEANLDYELEKFSRKAGYSINFNKAARQKYLNFAMSHEALWSANFRDLNSSVTRMATLSQGGRIDESNVADEILRLKNNWRSGVDNTIHALSIVEDLLGEVRAAEVDLFDQHQLSFVAKICRDSRSLAEAGRKLFNVSRLQKKSNNDSHRLKQFLDKYALNFSDLNDDK